MKKLKIKNLIITVPILTLPLLSLSCKQENDKIVYYDIYEEIKKSNKDLNDNQITELVLKKTNEFGISNWKEWIDSLTYNDWNRNEDGTIKNLECNSERQALSLYSCSWGHFWNEFLHKNETPLDQEVDQKWINLPDKGQKDSFFIRGSDWQFIQQALERAISPVSIIVYHGVEYQEVEFWDQLKEFISYNEQTKSYDYSKCKNKTITTLGFISTSTDKGVVKYFSEGNDWTTNQIKPPLKEKVMFKIKVDKGTKGIGYISGFELIPGLVQREAQFLIKKDSKFKILDVYKEGDTNIFEVKLIG